MRSGDEEFRHSLDRALRQFQPGTLRRYAWWGLAASLMLAALSFLHVATLELGPLRQQAMQVDELYFAACAARGTATSTTMAGCHDNKAPLIHLLYQAVQAGDAPYDLAAVKVAAFVTAGLIVVLAGWLARRFAGPVAALVTCALLLQAMSSNASVMAFKTDTVSAVLLLLALALLVDAPTRRGSGSWGWAGLCVGLAAVTKQTFILAAVPILAWTVMPAVRATAPGIGGLLRRVALFLLGLAVPFAVFLLLFLQDGRVPDYLASYFLYPSIYGGPHSGLSLRELAWRLAQVLDTLADDTLLTVLFAVAAVLCLNREYRRSDTGRPRMLVLLVTLVLLLVLVLSPFHFTYHTVPAWALMAILAGTVIGDLWPRLQASTPHVAVGLAGVLLLSALLASAGTWRTNGGRGSATPAPDESSAAIPGGDRYAYVLGTWPDFYVYNRLVPASDVMFPWALPGMPANWMYAPPDPASWRGQALARMHQRNVDKLYADFKRTPPAHIVVIDDMAHNPGSPRLSDVPGFDAYVHERCVPERTVTDRRRGVARVFRCTT